MSSGLGNGMGSAARWPTYHRQMDRLRERRDNLAVRRLDLVLLVTALALLGATAVFLADKSLSFALLDRSADVAINALTVLAAGSLAALALARYREAGRLAGLFQASAFLLIAWVALLNVSVVVLKVEDDFGLSLGRPEQLPLYISSISRLVAGALLVVGGAAAVGMVRGQPVTRRTLLVPSAAVTVVLFVLYLVREQVTTFDTLLPAFVGPLGIKAMITEPRFGGPMPDVTGIALLIQAVSAALFLVGVVLYRRSYLRDGPVADGYLAVAMLIGAFAEIHFYFYPGVYGGLVTTSEALRLAFFVVLFAGINAESRSDLRALRSAYAALDRMRISEAERATLEERTRLGARAPRRPRAGSVVRQAQARTACGLRARRPEGAGPGGDPGDRLGHRRGKAGRGHDARGRRTGVRIGRADVTHDRRLCCEIWCAGRLLRCGPARGSSPSNAGGAAAHSARGAHQHT